MSAGGRSLKVLTEDQVKEFRQAFDTFDTTGDGSISSKELFMILRGLGQRPTQVEVDRLIQEADSDRSKKINFEEFCKIVLRKMQANPFEEDLKRAWRVFDKTQRGRIGVTELREVMISLGEDMTDETLGIMIKEIDSDKDGLVTYDDFRRVMLERD